MSQARQVYFNGEYVPEAEARLSIFDSALMFGDMVFEMTRSFGQQPFRLREHIDRLYVGLRLLEIDCGLTPDEMEAATLELIERNRPCFAPGIDFQIMHDVSRGALPVYACALPEGARPTVSINLWPLTTHLAPLADCYETGVHAVIPSQRSVPARLIDPKIKNRSRIHYQIANQQAARIEAGAWALLMDEDGFLTEGTGSNFFLVKDGEIATPEPRNILRGVTRQAVIDVCREAGLLCHERNLEPYDAATADEAFFTSTPFVLMPVTRFEGQPIGDGRVGPVTRRVIEAFSEDVGVDFVAQAREYARMAAAGQRLA